jgi:hypothetical protein
MITIDNGTVQDILLVGIAIWKAAKHFLHDKPVAQKVDKVMQFIEEHKDGVAETVATVEQVAAAVISDNPAERDARIKAATYTALARLNTAIGELTVQDRAAIACYVRDEVPEEMKEHVTTETIGGVLNVVKQELVAAQNHKALTTALDAKELLGPLLKESHTQQSA